MALSLARATHAARRAFSLLEVLLAVIIIGLGMLGISALFAGAAAQQQASNETGRADRFAEDAAERLRSRLGRLADTAPDPDEALNAPAPQDPRQWVPIPAHPGDDGDDFSLSTRPIGDAIGNDVEAYFLVNAPGRTLFENPLNSATGEPSLDINGDDGIAIADSDVDPFEPFLPMTLPHQRIQPESYAVIVTVFDASENQWQRRRVRFIERDPETGGRPNLDDDQNSGVEDIELPIIRPDQSIGSGSDDTVILYRADATAPMTHSADIDGPVPDTNENAPDQPEDDPVDGLPPGTSAEDEDYIVFVQNLSSPQPFAYIEEFDFAADTSSPTIDTDPAQRQFVESIAITDYQRRNFEIASLNERLSFVNDASFPGGRRPRLGYTVLYRQRPDAGLAEAIILLYALAPQSRPDIDPNDDDVPFVPPEMYDQWPESQDMGPDNRDLLQEMQVTLGYDQTTQRYYIEPDADQSWVANVGQILVMSSAEGVGENEPDDPGADGPVTVVSQRTVDGDVRGLLSAPPRINGRSAIEDTTNTIEIHVWAMPPTVTSHGDASSITDTDTQWGVRPVAVRLIQIETEKRGPNRG